ncbi:MAG: hypothetical protein EOP07_09980 [Proteobacteria bacterium]|nr:MAG: hypothetical protein EOP07_09980 [Pseudomonadota bacterium]
MAYKTNRRDALTALGGLATLGLTYPGARLLSQTPADSLKEKKFVFTICAVGGANIVDSFLAQGTGAAAYENLVTIPNSPFHAAPVLKNSIKGAIDMGNGYAQETFLKKFMADTIVMTSEVSSVNHIVAAKRAMSGDNANGGRTLPEAVAMAYGKNLPLANLMLAGGGYAQNGDDTSVGDMFRAQIVSDPLMFAFATHGYKGITDLAGAAEIKTGRELRNQLELVSRFHGQFKDSRILDSYMKNREAVIDTLEKGDTVTKLMLLDPAKNDLAKYGFEVSKDINLVREKFTNMGNDIYEARLALAFLACKNGLSNSATIAPSQNPLIADKSTPNAPIAFDWSHVDHRSAQNTMWSYILKGIDGLIELLKATDVDGDPAKGKMWDRSVIYIATEFGRDKVSGNGSGHHLNNGTVMISPLLNGNKIYGGIDAATGLTHGFNAQTGEPDKTKHMRERDMYGVVCQALGIDYMGRDNYKAMIRGA